VNAALDDLTKAKELLETLTEEQLAVVREISSPEQASAVEKTI